MSRFSTLAIASALLGSAALMPATAEAAVYKFYSGGTYAGPFSAAGDLSLTLNPLATDTPSSVAGPVVCGGSDICGATLSFNDGPGGKFDFNATASGIPGVYVNEDLTPANGGMGVDGDGDDQINIGGANILKLDFLGTTVTITAIATLFDNAGHGPFFPDGTVPTEANVGSFAYRVGGAGAFSLLSFDAANAGTFGGLTGSIFEFQQGRAPNAEFYISGLNVVPLPGAALLFGTALAGLGWMRRRRQIGALESAAA